MAEKQASFGVSLDSNVAEQASEDASELEKLRQSIHGSQDAIKQMGSAMRALRGDTDAVKSAKVELKAKVEAERDAISRASLALFKQGTSYEKLADSARKATREQERLKGDAEKKKLEEVRSRVEKLAKGFHTAGGPVAELAGRLESLKGVIGGTGGAMGGLGLAAAGIVAVFAAIAAGVVAGAVSFAQFVIGGANAARSMNLVREAASGSAENAAALGTYVDDLSRKVATSKDKLNEMGSALTRTLSGSMASGQGIQDTFALVAESSAAMGEEVGKRFEDIITRGKQFGRIQINPFELQGSGVKFQDVAAELATTMHVSIAEAQAALFEGRVKLDDGAKALRTTIEKRFDSINARKLLDLDVQTAKLHEKFVALTTGVNLEPLLKGLDKIASLFDSTTVAGEAMKQIVTDFGNAFVESFSGQGVPTIESFVKSLVIMALKADIEFLKIKRSVLEFLGNFAGILTVQNVLLGFTAVVSGLAAAFVVLAASTFEFWGPIVLVGAAVAGLVALIPTLIRGWDAVNDWAKGAAASMENLGKWIVEGIANGIAKAGSFLIAKIKGLADDVKDAFKSVLKIGSPSKVFDVYGQSTAEGYAGGLERGTPAAQAAADALAPGPPPRPSGGGLGEAAGGGARGGGGPSVILNFSVTVEAGARGQEVAKALSEPSFLAQFTNAIEQAAQGLGVPTQAVTS